MNKFRIKVNDLENPSINQLKTNRSNPDLHEKSNLKILKGSNQPSNVPRSFWHDLYGQSCQTFYMTQVTQANSTKNKKYNDEQEGNKKNSQVGQIIQGVNKAVHRLKSLKQFRYSQDPIQKIDNKSEESVDSKVNQLDESFSKAYKMDKIYSMNNVEEILKKSIDYIIHLQAARTTQRIEKIQEDNEQNLLLRKKFLYNSLNKLLIEKRQKEQDLKKFKLELQKIKNGGKSDVHLIEKLKQETEELLRNIKEESQNYALVRQENNVLQNMMMSRKQDMMTLTKPFNEDIKRLKQLREVVINEQKYLNNSGKKIDQLRFSLDKEESEQKSMRTFMSKQTREKQKYIREDKLINIFSNNLIQENREKESDRKNEKMKQIQKIREEEKGRGRVIEQYETKISYFENKFRSIQNVIVEKWDINQLVEYHQKLQEDKRIMIEKCAEIEQLIEDTKYQTKQIQFQFQQVKISKLELDPTNQIEIMLEDDHILQKLQKELRSHEHQIMLLKEEVKSNDSHLAAYSKGFHAMVSANVKGFSNKLNVSQRKMISFQADHLADLFLKMLDSLKKIILEEPDYLAIDSS